MQFGVLLLQNRCRNINLRYRIPLTTVPMKRTQSMLLLLLACCTYSSISAQCTGGCPSGAAVFSTASPTTLATGSTYCASTTTNVSGNTYTINGKLVIQAGTVTMGSVTLNKTGVILIKFGAKL